MNDRPPRDPPAGSSTAADATGSPLPPEAPGTVGGGPSFAEPVAEQNVAWRLCAAAQRWPQQMAVAMPAGRSGNGFRYRQLSFRELDEETRRIAAGLRRLGLPPGSKLALLVPQSVEFISLVFAILRAGLVCVLIDPGMGRRNMIRCLEAVEVDGFVAIPLAQAIRRMLQGRFPRARTNVTVGRRWFWGGATLQQLRDAAPGPFDIAPMRPTDPAAIIFTTGSTGPPKGVLYQHGNFNQQIDELGTRYQIQPGEIDLPGFPLFALFNCALGVSTVIPEMDPTRPADVDPRKIVQHVRDWNVTQAFGSPALWNTVGRYCERTGEQLPTVRRVLSAGAPVPTHVLERIKAAIHPEGEIYTPYGATEALPVASVSGTEVLTETASQTRQGRGVCVGRRFPGIAWKVIEINDGPLASVAEVRELPPGEIGELMVRGPVVTERYVTREEANPLHKVKDGDGFWHRMGDLGYLDPTDRFWFCGRKAHRVKTPSGTLYTVPCEAIFNTHPRVYRSALVGIPGASGQLPVVIVETWPEHRVRGAADRRQLLQELADLAGEHEITRPIATFLIRKRLPVDIRHNAKIFREQLAPWAARRIAADRVD